VTEDPGWRPVLRRFAATLIPFGRRSKATGLLIESFRFLWLAFFSSMLFYVVVAILTEDRGDTSDLAIAGVLVVGIVVVGASVWFRQRSLGGGSVDELVVAYRKASISAWGIAVVPAFAGFVATLVTKDLVPTDLGVGLSSVSFFLAMPGVRDLQRRQERIDASGTPLPFRDAMLREDPGNPGPGRGLSSPE